MAQNLIDSKPKHQTMTLVFIDPQMAATILNDLGPQRIRRPNVVRRYSHDMEIRFWRLTHQAIAFDENGKLVDGQHRLQAIVESNLGQWFWVCEGLTRDELMVIDQHAKRTAADAISIQRGEFIDKDATAIVNSLVFYAGKPMFRWTLSVSEICIILSEYEDAIAFAMKQFVAKARGISTASVQAAVALAFYSESKTALERFCSVLSSGIPINGNSDTPALLLRSQLTTNVRYRPTDSPTRSLVCRLTQRAIRAFCSGEQLKILKAPETAIYELPGCGDLVRRIGRSYDQDKNKTP